MLARSQLKTAEELGLREKMHEGLIKVLDKMKSGELVWTPPEEPNPNGFNMSKMWTPVLGPYSPECGTVGCIAGWAHFLAGDINIRSLSASCTAQQRENYSGLICPSGWSSGLHTVDQACVALESYLLTGKADWS